MYPQILVVSAVVALLAAGAAKPTEVRLLSQTFGTDSEMARPAIQLVRTPEEWKAVWLKHVEPDVSSDGNGLALRYPAAPVVDFKRGMVLAFFDGQAAARRWQFVGAKTEKDLVTIRVRPVPIATVGFTFESNPFTFLFLSKNAARLVVEAPGDKSFVQVAEFGKAVPLVPGITPSSNRR